MSYFHTFVFILFVLTLTYGFNFKTSTARRKLNVKSMAAVFDGLAGRRKCLALANQLSNSQILRNPVTNSLPVAVIETKQGLYKEYTVERIDDSALDKVRATYKTAEETEENKTKYWAILAVLLAGSFAIPMVQYYWYVAEED